ncbi:MAG: hypothetical protein FJ109_02165 [Deltaproteobacteria bacterium]|nr:hypothetical protein [Deltaproteobacteria bacterium]
MRPDRPATPPFRAGLWPIAVPMVIAWTLLATACGGDGSELDPCGEPCPGTRQCDPVSGVCVETGPASLDGTDLAPRLAGTWQNGTPVVLVYDRIGQRFLHGSVQGTQMAWETAVMADEAVSPPGGPQIGFVSLTPQPSFLAETAPGEISLLDRGAEGWTSAPAGELPGPLSALSAVRDSGQSFQACAGDVNRTLWFASGKGGTVEWKEVRADGMDGSPSAPCAVAHAGGQVLLIAALRPAGLVSMWRDQDLGWQFSVLDSQTVPVALSVAPADTGLAAAWIDGSTGELRVARGGTGGIEVTTAAGASTDSASACSVSLATSANGQLRLAFRNADAGQLVLLGPQGAGPGWEPLAALPQVPPLLPLLGFGTDGGAEVAAIESPPAGSPGAGTFKRVDF